MVDLRQFSWVLVVGLSIIFTVTPRALGANQAGFTT
jgi:hypothetical protein